MNIYFSVDVLVFFSVLVILFEGPQTAMNRFCTDSRESTIDKKNEKATFFAVTKTTVIFQPPLSQISLESRELFPYVPRYNEKPITRPTSHRGGKESFPSKRKLESREERAHLRVCTIWQNIPGAVGCGISGACFSNQP